ncbi:MAG: hypothetical protein WHV26_14045 [Spirochaetota bacterium]
MQRLYILSIALLIAVMSFSVTIAQENENILDPFSQSKFVPDIAVIVDTSYVYNSLKDASHYERPGFIHHHEESDHHNEHGLNQNDGFNFNYAEISFYAPVDPYFDMFAVLHAGLDGAEIEEAYFTTQQLPFGFKIKGGKFLSSIGRINDRHAHYWDFADLPLIYQAFFGSQLNEIGVQINWLSPLPFYFLAACEILKGENEASFGTEGFEFESGAPYPAVEDARYPNVYTSFIKTSFDIGNFTVLLGASIIYGKTRINHGITESDGHAFYGTTYIAGTDLTLRYDFSSYQYIALQSEYLYRHKKGNMYEYDSTTTTKEDFSAKQSGLYSQLVIRTGQLTRIGLRYDLLAQNDLGNSTNLKENLPRYTAMLEYNPTEFSRFRLQYSYDKTLYDESDSNKVNHQIIFQCNLSIGAHGAHSF